MIHVVPTLRPEVAILGGSSLPSPDTVPHVPCAVSPAMLRRFEKAAQQMGERWGATATSSLLAHLEPLSTARDFIIVVVEFGPLAWVEVGKAMMTPLFLKPWFVVDDTWQSLGTMRGLELLIRAHPDRCLASPAPVMAAVSRVTGARLYESAEALRESRPDAPVHLDALAVPPHVVGREIHALAFFEGALGPLAFDVDAARATLRAEVVTPWKPMPRL